MRIAIVADVHLHDLHGGYGWIEKGSREIALRTFTDTMASTRVFNESYPAFLAVLDDILRHGIRDIVLLGDYSDDGQPGAVVAIKDILSAYEKRYGLRFFTTFGNHDCFGPSSHNQAKWLTKADGLNPVLITSDQRAPAPAVVCNEMSGMPTADAMAAMAHYGMTRPDGVFHWETPFDDRLGTIPLQDQNNLDASYLVEPQEGLWLLILDANIFACINGTWRLREGAAWDHVLTDRPYILVWIAGVAERARKLGKMLLAFSHYPVLPLTFTGNGDAAQAVGTKGWLKRMPSFSVARRLAEAGIKWHFSGHMHVAGRTEFAGLVNVAVPSPVAYPGGYCLVKVQTQDIGIDFVRLEHAKGFDIAFPAYQAQIKEQSANLSCRILMSESYLDYLHQHLLWLINNTHLRQDWTPEFIGLLDRSIEHVLGNDQRVVAVLDDWPQIAASAFRTMVEHYYLIRAAATLPPDLSEYRLGFYRALVDAIPVRDRVLPNCVREENLFLILFTAVWKSTCGTC